MDAHSTCLQVPIGYAGRDSNEPLYLIGYSIGPFRLLLYPIGCILADMGSQERHNAGPIARFVRERRESLGYTQPQLAERVGTGLRFVRELEMGKPTLRLDKVNQVLAFFGARLVPQAIADEDKP